MPGPDAGTAQCRGWPPPRTHTQGEEALVRARVPALATRRPAAVSLRAPPRARVREHRGSTAACANGGVAREREGGADRERADLRAAPRAQPAQHTEERWVRAEGGGQSPHPLAGR